MRTYNSVVYLFGFFVFTIFEITNSFAQANSVLLLGDFVQDWKQNWLERKLYQKPTRIAFDTELTKLPNPFYVEKDHNDLILKVESKESTSSLWRTVSVHPLKYGRIKWQWKVESSLTHNKKEILKFGDDYAARLIVVFEPHLLSWKTRAICYVWAGQQPVGSIYKNPYSKSVGMIVVESGNKHAGKWLSESRNFVADYREIFGSQPEMVSAVAIMVDTDNTHSQATAWFDDIILEYWQGEPVKLNLSIKIK